MHGNPVKRNGGREFDTRQFAMLQAVVVGNPEIFLTIMAMINTDPVTVDYY